MTPRERIEALESFDFEGMHKSYPDDFVPLAPVEALWLLRIARAAVDFAGDGLGGTHWEEGDSVSQTGADKLNNLISAVDDK